MMIFWIVIIGLLVYLLLKNDIHVDTFKTTDPLRHLDERLAKGDIDIDEYQRLKHILKEDHR